MIPFISSCEWEQSVTFLCLLIFFWLHLFLQIYAPFFVGFVFIYSFPIVTANRQSVHISVFVFLVCFFYVKILWEMCFCSWNHRLGVIVHTIDHHEIYIRIYFNENSFDMNIYQSICGKMKSTISIVRSVNAMAFSVKMNI